MKPSLLQQSCVYILLSHFLLLLIDFVNFATKLYTKYLGGFPLPSPQFVIKPYFLLDTCFFNNQIKVNRKLSILLLFFFSNVGLYIKFQVQRFIKYDDFCLPCGGTHLSHSQILALQAGYFVVFVPNDDGWIVPKIDHSFYLLIPSTFFRFNNFRVTNKTFWYY